MSLDNLSKRQELSVHKLYVRLSQSLLRFNVRQQSTGTTKWNNKMQCDVRLKLYEVPPTYSPIKSDDLCLEDLLLLHPRYKFERE